MELSSFEGVFDEETIELYTEEMCTDLADELNRLTGLKIYEVYNECAPLIRGMINSMHFLVKLKDQELFVDITGMSKIENLQERWSKYEERENPGQRCKIAVIESTMGPPDFDCPDETKKIAQKIVELLKSNGYNF